jgi:membrane protease YdiL (CAAX protease family)
MKIDNALKYFLVLFIGLCSLGLSAQNDPGLTDHKIYLNILNHSKDSLYSQILSTYDKYILRHESDYKVQLERCRFIQNAYYDFSEDYNPKYEEAEQCGKDLVSRFPEIPEVLLFRAEGLYGDSAIAFLKKVELKINAAPDLWKNYSWKVYESLASNYQNDSSANAIFYGLKAMQRNDTLDLTLLVGRLYKEKNQNKRAIEILSEKLEIKQNTWSLNQKAKLLLELGATDKAIEAFNFAKKDTIAWQDAESLAQAFLDKGLIAEARDYLAKDARKTWNNDAALYRLFDYDIKYGIADSARVSYLRLTKEKFLNDPIGIARIRLFIKAPFSSVSLQDVGRILLLLATIAFLALIPYAWILPIHYYGKSIRKITTFGESRWGLRHLWLAFSVWFIIDFVVLALLDYLSIIQMFNDLVQPTVAAPVNYTKARYSVFFFSALFTATVFLFLRWNEVVNSLRKLPAQISEVMRGVGLAIAMRVGLVIYLAVVNRTGLFPKEGSLSIFSINDDIMSINKFYHPLVGFLFVVILVPIYEEILFRGVFLSATKKYLQFYLANAIQAFTFALAHNNLKLFIFYFVFAVIAGHYQNRTGSLTTGMSMHATNNLIAFLGILYYQERMG